MRVGNPGGAGFEPAAYGLEVRCSTQLSYPHLIPELVRFHVRYTQHLPQVSINFSLSLLNEVRRWPGGYQHLKEQLSAYYSNRCAI